MRCRSGEEVFCRALETHVCPRTVRFKKERAQVACCHGQLSAGSGEGQSVHTEDPNVELFLEREEASNQTEWLPLTNGLQLCAGLAPSPP